jgi:hypothetical protein
MSFGHAPAGQRRRRRTRGGTNDYRKIKSTQNRAPDEASLVIEQEESSSVLYVELEGKRIAKRYPGQRWINLEPGYSVRGAEPGDLDVLAIEYHATEARPQ